MPNQCVKCNKFFDDGSNQLLKGCDNCGGKFFFYIKKNELETAKKITQNLSNDDKQQIVQDVFGIIGNDYDNSMPVFLDFESIRVISPGKYELDIVNLFKGKPVIYRIEDGKYIIDLKSTFKNPKEEYEVE